MGRDQREAAYVAFVAARQAHFRRIAYALCGDWAQAEDLLQVALVKLYVAWPRVKRDGREEAYVRQILVRANIDESRRPWHREQPVDTLPDRAEPVPPDTDHGQLLEAVLQLPLMQRRTVVLRLRFDDFSRATRSRTLPRATAHTGTLLAAIQELFAAAHPLVAARGLTLVGVAIANLQDDAPRQLVLPFDDADMALDAALDRVRERFGSRSVTRAVVLGIRSRRCAGSFSPGGAPPAPRFIWRAPSAAAASAGSWRSAPSRRFSSTSIACRICCSSWRAS